MLMWIYIFKDEAVNSGIHDCEWIKVEHDSISITIRVLPELWVCLPTLHWHRKWIGMRGDDGDRVAMMVMVM